MLNLYEYKIMVSTNASVIRVIYDADTFDALDSNVDSSNALAATSSNSCSEIASWKMESLYENSLE